jgi:PAS domain S-box-containing protein
MPNIYQQSLPNATDESGKSFTADGTYVQQQFQFILEDSPLAIYTCDKDGYLNFFNKSAVKLWGNVPVLGKDLWCGSWKIYYPDGREMPFAECPMAITLRDGRSFDSEEITIETPDHIFKRVLVSPRPIYDNQNNLIGAHNTLVDVSDKILVESRQAVLSAIVESSDDAIISKNLNGIIISWNAGAQRIFGYTEQEIIGKSITILIPAERRKEEENILRQIRSGNKVDHFETIRVSKSGKDIPISITVSPVKDCYGNIIGASKIARDISEQIEAQNIIRENARNLELLNSIGKILLDNLDVNTLLQQVTDATTKITGAAFGAFFYDYTNVEEDASLRYTLSGASKEGFEKFKSSKEADIFKQIFVDGKVVRIDDVTKEAVYRRLAAQDELFPENPRILSYLSIPVKSTVGVIIGTLIFAHPKTGMFKSEHEDMVSSIAAQAGIAIENSRLFEEVKALSSKKDEFIALASHELKTPLTTINGYLQVLSKKNQDSLSKMFVDKSLYQVQKLNTLISDLLDISKIEAGKLQFNLEPFSLTIVLQEVLEAFPYTNTSHQIIFDISSEECLVLADKQRIEQVIINLLTNAIKYSPSADQVHVSIKNEGELVTVRIKDQGIGMKAEHLNKIFTRFYRAEGVGNVSGLGIGLHLTKEIVDRHNGHIHVISEYGKGSEFSFSLPRIVELS